MDFNIPTTKFHSPEIEGEALKGQLMGFIGNAQNPSLGRSNESNFLGKTTGVEIDTTVEVHSDLIWGGWFGSMDTSVLDVGNPVGKSQIVNSDSSISTDGVSNPMDGHSLIECEGQQDALFYR